MLDKSLNRYIYYNKPKKCPKCKSETIGKIQWGYPAYSEQMQKDLDRGKIVLGGCCITDDDPCWQCVDCGLDIYRKLRNKKP